MVLTDAPSNYSSIHDDLVYVVYDAKSGDSTTYPNYKYIADIYVNGTLVATVRKVQQPTTGHGIFSIGNIIRNYIATTFNPSPSVLVSQKLASTDFFLNVVVKFGEEYNYTSYYDELVDDSRIFFNNYNGRLVGTTSSLTSKTDKLATNNNLSGKVLLSSSFYLVPYFPTSTSAVTVNVTPNGSGSSFSTSFTPTAAYELQVLNLSPVALNAIHAGAIASDTTSYTVTIGSQTYIIKVICEAMYSTYMVHFLNRYGGFESFLFPKVSRTKYKIEKKDFGKLNYTVDGSGIIQTKNTNGVYNENRSVYSVQYDEKLTLNSDLLTDSEYTWLADLILSPMVFIQDGAYFFPVVISANDYEPKKAVNDDLTNLTIEIEYGQPLNAQYR